MTNNNFQDILSKFTYHFKKVLINAQNLAYAKKNGQIEPEDLLHSLLHTKGALGSDILIKQKINPEFLNETKLADSYQPVSSNPENLPQPSMESQEIIEKAVVTAYKFQHKYIGTEHLLWGISHSENEKIKNSLQKANINVGSLKQNLNMILKSTSKFSDLASDEELKEIESVFDENDDLGILENFTINLTDKEIQKNIDPVIGRSREIDRVIEILSRRTKNNPVLLGDAGVGKTAIIEGLAKRITENKVPDVLLSKTILNLDLSSLIAGTMYRGEFENRLKQVISEIKNNPDIILFIDELHTIMGAGATSGSLDAANILKPALSRGQLRCIGATTFEEYKKHIESDKALERRFQPVVIEESSEAETRQILEGLRSNYEKFHNVKISEQALDSAVSLSKRFLPNKKLPDKAIDLIDEAAARLRVKNTKKTFTKEIKKVKEKIAITQENKRQAILDENYIKALEYKNKEENYLEQMLNLQAQDDKSQKEVLGQINEDNIRKIIADIAGIPEENISIDQNKQLAKLENQLGKNIFGQSEALRAVANTIRKSKAGLHDKNRPLASFIFLGPSGVGKTETAKQIARHVFGGTHNMTRIDMSEFSEKFNISKLIGSPAGYVGYKDSNKLTDMVKNKPYSLVLFDEIEKAHPDVYNLLLPILEEGELTDSTGRTINFRNTIIAMTSNIGLAEFNQQAVMGFEESKDNENFQNLSERIVSSLNKHFPPEFINRLDNTIVFKPLDKASARKIIKQEVNSLTSKLVEQNIKINIDPKVINQLIKLESASKDGARSLKRLIDDQLTNPLAAKLLEKRQKQWNIKLEKDKISIK